MTTDLAAVKQRQQATWATGDFSVIASRLLLGAENLCEAADLQAGWRTLDVATGSGTLALSAARRGCIAVGADYVPALLDRGRLRAEAEHLSVEFVVGDTENLPFPDASFDAVTSIYGSMFAPDHTKAASELARVCKPGGRIALASWTPDGYPGEMFRLFSRYAPPPPGLQPPTLWGTEPHLRTIFGPAIRAIASNVRQAIFRFVSPQEHIEVFRAYFGPTVKAYASLPLEKQEELTREWTDLIKRFDRNKSGVGPIAIVAAYLESVIQRA
jgi:ubiquinone/menaquinone biosynthesis C-methylase UbiE